MRIADNIAELSLVEEFHPVLDNIDAIKTLYEKYSRFDCHHWLFDPLLKAVETRTQVTVDEMRTCLTFISSVVKKHDNYCRQLISSESALYCLISSVFLVSEEVFFDEYVQKNLHFMLKTLLRSGIRCQISDRVPYFETCGDLYVFICRLDYHSFNCLLN